MARKNPQNPYPLSHAQRAIVKSVGGDPDNLEVTFERFVPGKRIQGIALGPLTGGLWTGAEPWGLVATNGLILYFNLVRYPFPDQLKSVRVGDLLRIDCLREDQHGDLHFQVVSKTPRNALTSHQ